MDSNSVAVLHYRFIIGSSKKNSPKTAERVDHLGKIFNIALRSNLKFAQTYSSSTKLVSDHPLSSRLIDNFLQNSDPYRCCS